MFNAQIFNPYIIQSSSLDYNSKINLDPNPVISINSERFHNDNFNLYNLDNKKYKYVFVMVMEQTSVEDFYREKSLIKGEDFFDRVHENTHFFTNYYSSNQDSRTAIWEMLNSFFIPFESYIEPWQDYYGYLLETNNLINHLKENQIMPYSVSSVGDGSLILGIYHFNNFIRMYDYEKESNGFLCSTDFSYQKACEDLAIFNKLTSHILENKEEDLFYFQEMIFGHGEKYMELSGKTRIEYYNNYFNQFYDFLEKEKLINQSLIIIVSDHGPKGGPKTRVVEDFNIPLMIIANDLKHSKINNFYSHFSFKDILLSYYLGSNLPKEESLIYLIDQSGRSLMGYIDVKKNYSVLGEFKDSKFFFNNEKGVEIESIKKEINIFLEYQKYIRDISINNHSFVQI